MTICIAAACVDGGGNPCIVLCSDTRLDFDYIGSTNMACKLDILGHGWSVQMAGDWGNVVHWKDLLKREVQASKAANVEQVSKCVGNSAECFMKSVFCESGKSYQLLLSGFPDKERVILLVNLYPAKKGHSLTVTPTDSFACIGSGAVVANAILSARECHWSMSVEYVSYLVYEAKKLSEKTGGVGTFTALVLHAPGAEETVDRAHVEFLTEAGEAQLDVYYRGIWKVPFVKFPEFPQEFFTDYAELFTTQEAPRDPQRTKADPKPPQPSPESPSKSDES